MPLSQKIGQLLLGPANRLSRCASSTPLTYHTDPSGNSSRANFFSFLTLLKLLVCCRILPQLLQAEGEHLPLSTVLACVQAGILLSRDSAIPGKHLHFKGGVTTGTRQSQQSGYAQFAVKPIRCQGKSPWRGCVLERPGGAQRSINPTLVTPERLKAVLYCKPKAKLPCRLSLRLVPRWIECGAPFSAR
jgi:hypothetical protein